MGTSLWARLKRPPSRVLGPERSREVGPPNFLERPGAAMRMRNTGQRRAGLKVWSRVGRAVRALRVLRPLELVSGATVEAVGAVARVRSSPGSGG